MKESKNLCADIMRHVDRHESIKRKSISLVPTENLLSPRALSLLQSDLANRYYLTDNTIWEYPQIEQMGMISDICQNALKKLYDVSFVNVRPISGINCLTVILAALTKSGQTLYSVNPNCGGHGATRVIAERLGLKSLYLPYDYFDFDLDYDKCKKVFQEERPDFIYIDMSNSLFPIRLDRLFDIAPEDTFIHFDASQIMGLIPDGSYFNPLRFGCKLLAGSTHKTFPGPQHGMILSNDEALMNRIEIYTNTFVSNHHMNEVAALAVTALEMLEYGHDYSRRIQSNAITLGNELSALGVPVVSCGRGITSTHQVWIHTEGLNEDVHEVVARLEQNQIITNCVRLPLSPSKMTKGIRLGTTDVSRRGMGGNEMKVIARLIHQTLFHNNASSVRSAVEELARRFPGPVYCFMEEK